MKEKRTLPRAEALLPGLTVLFLCALLALYHHDGKAAAAGRAETEKAAAQTSFLPATAPVNLNTAGAEELENLPGIGAALARRILEYREVYGPFQCVEELAAVPGISGEKLAGLADYITTDGGGNE